MYVCVFFYRPLVASLYEEAVAAITAPAIIPQQHLPETPGVCVCLHAYVCVCVCVCVHACMCTCMSVLCVYTDPHVRATVRI